MSLLQVAAAAAMQGSVVSDTSCVEVPIHILLESGDAQGRLSEVGAVCAEGATQVPVDWLTQLSGGHHQLMKAGDGAVPLARVGEDHVGGVQVPFQAGRPEVEMGAFGDRNCWVK